MSISNPDEIRGKIKETARLVGVPESKLIRVLEIEENFRKYGGTAEVFAGKNQLGENYIIFNHNSETYIATYALYHDAWS